MFSFLKSISNPVFKRELLAGLRSPRLLWVLFFYMVIPFVAVILSWPTGRLYYGGHDLGLQVWRGFIISEILSAIFLIPIFAAYSVSSEFEQRTAEFLWTTAIPSELIVLSKMLAVVLLGLSVQIASLPALSMIFFLGGVGIAEVLQGCRILMVTILFTAVVAVYFSARFRKGHLALLCTYGFLSVFIVFFLNIFHVVYQAPAGNQIEVETMTNLILALTIPIVLQTIKTSKKPIDWRARKNFKPIDDVAQLERRRKRWPYYLVDPLRRLSPMPDSDDKSAVVALHEKHVHPLNRSVWGYRCCYAIFGVSVICISTSICETHNSRIAPGLFWINLAVAGVWVVLVHAISMTMDQEMATLHSLRLTEITPQEFLKGKWLGSFRMRWPLLLCGALSLVPLCLFEKTYSFYFLILPLIWIVSVECLGWMAYAIASFSSKTSAAIALCLVGLVGFFVTAFFLGITSDSYLNVSYRWFWYLFGFNSKYLTSENSWRSLRVLPPTLEHEIFRLLFWICLAGSFYLITRYGVRRKWNQEE
jgi:ABC-type transport system involved in multi-copper enzyme maturation permease subunit